ncbi:MAG: hypothetical protein WC552_02905 [Candidatus Omnitrophota bacterium]
MTLQEIIDRQKTPAIYEKRNITDDYGEIVFYSKDRDEWHKLFAEILGPAIKPEGAYPTPVHLDMTKNYGGIRSDQTLFKKEYEDSTVIAMFWPWQDGVCTTLKMIFLEKKLA